MGLIATINYLIGNALGNVGNMIRAGDSAAVVGIIIGAAVGFYTGGQIPQATSLQAAAIGAVVLGLLATFTTGLLGSTISYGRSQ